MRGVISQVLLVEDLANILAGLLAVNQDDQSTEYRRGVAAGIRAVAAATGARLPPAVLVWDVAEEATIRKIITGGAHVSLRQSGD